MSTIVLHNLPVGCMESDIHRALLIYGSAVRVEVNTALSQAVVTMRTPQEAQALLNRHSVNVSGTSVRVDTQQAQPAVQPVVVPPPPPALQQQQHPAVGMQGHGYAAPQSAMYSNTAPSPYPVVPPPPQQPYPQQYPPQPYAPQPYAPPSMQGSGGGYIAPLPIPTPLPPQAPAAAHPAVATSHASAILPAPQQTSRRLRVDVEDCRYPITREVLQRMFAMIAPPVFVTCGPYGPTTTGMVEFADPSAAQQAVTQYDGKPIYPDCCYVHLHFEPMWEVARSTARAQPIMGEVYPGGPGSAAAYGPLPIASGQAALYPQGEQSGYYGAGGHEAMDHQHMGGRGSGWGGEGSVQHAGLMVRGGRGGGARGMARGGAGQLFAPYESTASSSAPPTSAPFSSRGAADASGGERPVTRPVRSDSVVSVSGVPTSIPLYNLWVLLEVYGNVKALRREVRDPTNVMAHFYHALDTVSAVRYLNGCNFYGARLLLKRFMGYQERPTPFTPGPSRDPATMWAIFEQDYHHRIGPKTPRKPYTAMRPAPNIFITNLGADFTDAEVEELVRETGLEPVSSLRRDKNSSIVALKDVETAVKVLVAVHLKTVRGRMLYATFSRFAPVPWQGKKEEQKSDAEEEREGAEEGDDAERPVSPPQPRVAEEVLAPVENVEDSTARKE